jgi:RNA polymerase sigma-70 factor (sigma-E family)
MSGRRTRDEFDRFVGESVDGLLRAAYLIVWDVAEAEDLVQECFFRLARRWTRVRRMEHPRAYARRVLVNLALDASGPSRRRSSELGGGIERMAERADDDAARLFGRVEAGNDLEGALGELAPRQRAVLVLRYFEDLPEAQVAALMGCSVGTVKSTTARALERLRGQAGLRDDQTSVANGPDPTAAIGATTSTSDTGDTNDTNDTSERSVTR